MSFVLALITLVVFWPLLHCGFINYDDPEYFSGNAHVLNGLNWKNFCWALGANENCSWYPLTWMSFLLDVSIFGTGPRGPHLTNLLLHTVNSVLLFLLLSRLTGAAWRSALVAALFALHPLHVESVAWIAERKDVLSTLFGLLAIWAYAGHAGRTTLDSPGCLRRIASSGFYWMGLLLFACSLLAKPMLVTLPVILLLLDYWPLRRLQRATVWPALLEKAPFALGALAATAVIISVHREAGVITTLSAVPMGARIENAFVSYARYLGKTFWPARLALPYPHPGTEPTDLVLSGVALILVLSSFALIGRKQRPYFFVGWFWFLVMLTPVIGLIQWASQSIADRFTYLPLVGVFIILIWGTAELAAICRLRRWQSGLLAACLVAASAALTRHQVQFWQNSELLFRHTVLVTQGNYVAQDKLGLALFQRGNLDQAEAAFAAALQIAPRYDPAVADMARLAFERQDFTKASALLLQLLERHPNNALTHSDLGMALAGEGKIEEAIGHYRSAVHLEPARPEVLNNLAWQLATHPSPAVRNGAEAVTLAQRACQITAGTNFWMLSTLAAAYAETGNFDDAARTQAKVCELSKTSVPLQQAEIFQRRLELYQSRRPYFHP